MPHVQSSIDGQVQLIPHSMTARARASDAIWASIADCGVDPRWIDVAYVANCYHGFFTGQGDAIAPVVIGGAGHSLQGRFPEATDALRAFLMP